MSVLISRNENKIRKLDQEIYAWNVYARYGTARKTLYYMIDPSYIERPSV